MRIRLQNFVSIQPRTSLENSDVSWPASLPACQPASLPTFFSAVAVSMVSRGLVSVLWVLAVLVGVTCGGTAI